MRDVRAGRSPVLTSGREGGPGRFRRGKASGGIDRVLPPIEAISPSALGERLPQARTGDEVERLTTTLNARLDRLDAASRQRQFASGASHELRTPLTAMRADLEIFMAYRGP